jgi:hypothetical protein
MATELEGCFQAYQNLEAQRSQVLARLAEWEPRCLTYRPSPEAWSAAEVLDHIVRAEVGTVHDLRSGLRHPHNLGSAQRPSIATLSRILRSDKKFQVPGTAASIHPNRQITLPEVTHRWEQARRHLQLVLQRLSPADTGAGVFQHPFAGWMTVQEVLENFGDHLYHHEFQLERLRAACAAQPPGHTGQA